MPALHGRESRRYRFRKCTHCRGGRDYVPNMRTRTAEGREYTFPSGTQYMRKKNQDKKQNQHDFGFETYTVRTPKRGS